MKSTFTTLENCVEVLHKDTKNWISKVEFLIYEIDFIKHDLLLSTAFNPYSKNLFDTNRELGETIKNLKATGKLIVSELQEHNNKIGGIIECSADACDLLYWGNHQILKEKIELLEAKFQENKKILIDYACEILRHKKK